MYSIEIPFLNLEQIYKSGQVFRWIKFSDTKYVIPFGDKVVKVFQQRKRLIFDCDEETFYQIWYYYFDLQTDYMELNYQMQRMSESIKSLANRGNGIRLLNQDPIEMLITYAIGGKNYQEIKWNVTNLCILCGKLHNQSMRELGKVTWHEFPSVDIILRKENLLRNSCLFKDTNVNFDLLFKVCHAIKDGLLQKLLDNECNLCDELGYNHYAAKLVLLHGLHISDVFYTTHKLKAFINDVCQMSIPEFRQVIRENGLVNNKGYVRQILIYNMTNPPKGGWN